MAIRTRSYRGEADLQAVLDLLIACKATGRLDDWPTMMELRLLLTMGLVDQEQDVRLWENENGSLAAFAVLWEGPYLVSFVHPQGPGQALAEQILAWGRERTRALCQAGKKSLILSVSVREDEGGRIALLKQQGFTPRAWQTLRMARSLREPIPAPDVPEGIIIRPLAGEPEAANYVALHHEAFGTSGMNVAHRLALMRDPAYLPALDLVAAAPDGRLVAFCTCSVSAEENARLRRHDGWVALMATRPAYRGKGLGRALLLAGLEQLKAQGVERALLGTQSKNTSARQLYESAGFRTLYKVFWYARAL
jgi:mycothiol synthase